MICVEKLGARDASYDDFLTDLQSGGEGECRYGLYDFEYEHQCQGTTESSKKQKLFLMSWCPDSAKIKKKMLYTRELQEAEAVPDVLVPRLGQNQEENVVRQLFRDIEKVLGWSTQIHPGY